MCRLLLVQLTRDTRREAGVSRRRTDDPSDERALLIEFWLLSAALAVSFGIWAYQALFG